MKVNNISMIRTLAILTALALSIACGNQQSDDLKERVGHLEKLIKIHGDHLSAHGKHLAAHDKLAEIVCLCGD